MQDIDFDEIDRAVNSVTNTPSSAPTVPADPAPVVEATTQDPTPTPRESPTTVAERPATSSPAARRSSGRFMDVVHPSSDMRPELPGRPQTDETQAVQPVDDTSQNTGAADLPEPTPASRGAFHWPDPVDVAPAALEAPILSVEDIAVEETAEVNPLESPFLSNAKVEKRPLGAFSTSDEATNEPAVEVLPPSNQQEEPLLEAENPVEATAQNIDSVEAAETVEEKPAEAIVGPTSITQQYQEQPPSDPQTSGSIFDTEAYHQPLTQPAKKRSKVVVILWVFALIVLGGGVGAALYFLVLPMLG